METSVESLHQGAFFDEWGALARESSAGIFATPEWHVAVQQAYGSRGRPAVGTFRDGGRLVGVAPFRIGRQFLFRDATLLGMGEGGYGLADYGGLSAASGCERQVASAVLAWLRDEGAWDVLDLQQLPDGPLTRGLLEAIKESGLRWILRRQNICNVVPLPSTWAEYRARLSSNTRQWLERRPRLTERDLAAHVELVEPDRVLEEYAVMRNLQAERFGGQPPELEQRIAIVMRSWLPMAQRRGWLRMFRLTSRSQTIGVLLGYEYERAFYVHSSAFDSRPEVARYGLGASLHASALRWSIDHGLDRFDLLRGNYAYKQRLGGRPHDNYRVMVFRESLLGRAIEAALHVRALRKGKPTWRKVNAGDGEVVRSDGSEHSTDAPGDVASAAVGVE